MSRPAGEGKSPGAIPREPREPSAPSLAARACLLLIGGYQRFISPLKPSVCRFSPSCSHYGREAFRLHGFWKGLRLTLWRILRCHPFYRGPLVDPVPPPPTPREASLPARPDSPGNPPSTPTESHRP